MKVLLVEDDKTVSHFIEKGLKETNYIVDIAIDGEDGLHLALSQSYDIIILDIMLPKIDGWGILKSIREVHVKTPVLFLTAKDTKEDIVKGLELGADDYLVKPFSFVELLARIRAIIRRDRKDVAVSQLTVGNLTLDLVSRTAQRDEEKIELSSKEFLLLEYLMRNTGQILTRTMILESVWGYNFDIASNIIDVHINHLRNKIDKNFASKLIHTIKGVGYVIKDE